jgi:hypothetical protein
MVELCNENIIAHGRSRDCYLHPKDPGRVIKISTLKRRRRRDSNWREWKHYEYLMKRHGPMDFISHCYGFVDTNLGPGLVCDCVRDHDGKISKTLFQISTGDYQYDVPRIENALTRYVENLIVNNIQLFDFSLPNIVIQVTADGGYHPVSVDLKGRFNNREFIPVSTYIAFMSRRKLARRGKRLLEEVRHFS